MDGVPVVGLRGVLWVEGEVVTIGKTEAGVCVAVAGLKIIVPVLMGKIHRICRADGKRWCCSWYK
jgi:hypothetical protein